MANEPLIATSLAFGCFQFVLTMTPTPRLAPSIDSLCSEGAAIPTEGQPAATSSDIEYRDFLHVEMDRIKHEIKNPEGKRKGPRGGVTQPFPTKLYSMLAGVQKDGIQDIVSWQPHGRCFLVHKGKEFADKIMPKYFNQSKLSSFQRQLNLYGFKRLRQGPDSGGYYHELFLRQRPELCEIILRTGKKDGNGKGCATSAQTSEPNLYRYPYCEEVEHVNNEGSSDEMSRNDVAANDNSVGVEEHVKPEKEIVEQGTYTQVEKVLNAPPRVVSQQGHSHLQQSSALPQIIDNNIQTHSVSYPLQVALRPVPVVLYASSARDGSAANTPGPVPNIGANPPSLALQATTLPAPQLAQASATRLRRVDSETERALGLLASLRSVPQSTVRSVLPTSQPHGFEDESKRTG